MTSKLLLAGAVAMGLTPALASAQSSPPGNGQYNGSGYWHTNSGNATGQPNQDCQDLVASGQGAYPGNSSSSPGAPFNETNGNAGGQYAGSQPQNSRNTASVSQYDVACSNQPQ
ncbi:MAG TPA: hypothetical protein VLM36_11135 [Sphingomicrobium sp.]|nr:hypothetical protein [Sphingomicrobium sp.]